MNTVAATWLDPSADSVVVVEMAADTDEEVVVEKAVNVEFETGADAPETGTDGSPIDVVVIVTGWDAVGSPMMVP